MSRGLTIIYTGDGKGKTTAAMGLAVRAAGYGRRILILQFIKTWFTGEKAALQKLGNVEFVQAGKGFYKIRGDQKAPEEHQAAAVAALNLARTKLHSGDYDVVILDEIIGSVTGGLLDLAPVLELVDSKPKAVDLVLTGHQGHKVPELLERADLVTEMTKIKHPYDRGMLARRTIDY